MNGFAASLLRISIVPVAVLPIICCGCGGVASTHGTPAPPDVFRRVDDSRSAWEDYVIAAPDELELRAGRDGSLNGLRAGVGPDGDAAFGPLGRVRAEGKTVAEVTAELRSLAARSGFSSDVSVSVVPSGNRFIWLFGPWTNEKVRFTGRETVRSVLIGSHPWPPGRPETSVWLVRPARADHPPARAVIDAERLLHGGDASQDFRLLPGDALVTGSSGDGFRFKEVATQRGPATTQGARR